jgi:hypothetical protein
MGKERLDVVGKCLAVVVTQVFGLHEVDQDGGEQLRQVRFLPDLAEDGLELEGRHGEPP